MLSNHLLSPRPVAPFEELNYGELINRVCGLQKPLWADASYRKKTWHSCQDSFFISLQPVNSVNGLNLV